MSPLGLPLEKVPSSAHIIADSALQLGFCAGPYYELPVPITTLRASPTGWVHMPQLLSKAGLPSQAFPITFACAHFAVLGLLEMNAIVHLNAHSLVSLELKLLTCMLAVAVPFRLLRGTMTGRL